jgi:hypothetical protein
MDQPDPDDWDANDPRRRQDPMAPPTEPCECYCLHCGRAFMSDQMWLQRIIGGRDSFDGFWMCPTPNCSGAGFTFDIFPTDPAHPANAGWFCDDDEDYMEEEDEEPIEWDPEETRYKQLDEQFGEADDDIEGEEWKYGLEPGEQSQTQDWAQQARKEQEDEERRYNEPDQRPRELDWSNREDGPQTFNEDDIPF